MAKTIVATLRKGGSGKTTTAINLATALMERQKKTLLIDLDPQANATIGVGQDPTQLRKHINQLFTDVKTTPEEIIMKTPFGLDLMPSHPSLADTEAGMKATQIGSLKAIIQPIDNLYDYIIIDTPPSETFLTVNALATANEVIIPLQTHFLAMKGLQAQLVEIEQIRKGLNPNLNISGILPTMVNHRTNISQTILESIKQEYGDLVYPFQINWSIRHTEASLAGEPIIYYDPSHQGSKAYRKLANTFI